MIITNRWREMQPQPPKGMTDEEYHKERSKNMGKYYVGQKHPPSKIAFKLNTSRARGELKLLKEIVADHAPKWTQVFKEGDLLWSGLAIPIEDIGIAEDIMLNRLPEMTHLCHKKTMGFILNKFVEFWPEEYWFYPKTYLIPEEYDQFEEKINRDGGVYIAKPSAGSQGDGIILVTKPKDIPLNSYTNGNQEYVVQPYIDNPLLLEKKKFDLRLYILVSSLDPYICYLNEQGLARFCAEDYQLPSKENIKNPYIHLTNYSLNKNHEKFVATEGIFGKGNKRCLKVLYEQLEDEGIDVAALREKIEEVSKKFLIGLYPFLKYYYKAAFPKKNGRCFHVIGLDILVDKNLTPWILEANANPSLNIDHEVYKSTGETLTEVSEIDKYVKRMVVQDALFIMRKPLSSQKEMEEGEQYYSYKKILNANNEQLEEMNIFEDMLKIFHHLTGVKTKRVITASQFGKLSRFAGMTNEKITKNDYHLVFIKIMRTSFNPTQMDFEGLIKALEYLAKEIHGYDAESKYQVMRDQVTSIVSEIEPH